MDHIVTIARELGIKDLQTRATINLLDEGATVPFISRYRKEVTGSLDDQQVSMIRDRMIQLRELDDRKKSILKSILEQGKLDDELEKKIREISTLTELEDLYLPYRPKRKTRASTAREKGLEPLAKFILDQNSVNIQSRAAQFINKSIGVPSEDEALQGARDIIAEIINENSDARKSLRKLYFRTGIISSKVNKKKIDHASKYKDYFDWQESIKKIPSHRLLALFRGEKEGFLSVSISPDELEARAILERQFVKNSSDSGKQVQLAITDCYKRLMSVSMSTEVRSHIKQKADQEAINVFAENLEQLLMAAPLGQKSVLAIDPGFRTGCKVVCLDKQGKLIDFHTIYPNEPHNKGRESGETIKHLVNKYHIEAIAIGNGTAGRETFSFVNSLQLHPDMIIAMVNESGASIYSASEIAREEFPSEDVTVRGSVSIGRRMMDPLAELVKIDPKSIGVGQYQHDVDQQALKKSLDDVVMRCVNHVGVELNTASKQLLTYVSGVGPQIAENIVKYRDENGPFRSREALKKVPRLGGKAFIQCAGFLRILDSKNPLDRSAVHPEQYNTVSQMAKEAKASISDLMSKKELRSLIDPKKYVTDNIGIPTLMDILKELEQPGRDPRASFVAIKFQEGINQISDLKPGMKLPGIVSNITKFGAFVDIGVHQDGLVHVSHLSNEYVSDPMSVVKLGQNVMVQVLEIDIPRKRISLSMKTEISVEKPLSVKKTPEEKSSKGDIQTKLAQLKGRWNT